MIFWIGFFIMFFNEGFVMMRHVSPWFAKQRERVINKLGVTLGLIVNSNRLIHISALAIFWIGSFVVFYLPRWKRKRRYLNLKNNLGKE